MPHYLLTKPRSSAGGFSLIELLVSIAVIAILAAILLPAIGAIRTRSLATKDAAQLRNWGTLWLSHCQTENSVRHWAGGVRPQPDPAPVWSWYMRDEMGIPNEALRRGRSPMYQYDDSRWDASEFYGFVLNNSGTSTRDPDDGSTVFEMQFTDAENPADTPWVANSFNGTKQTHTIRPLNSATLGAFHLVHDGFANMMFLDGHLERVDAKRLHELGMQRAWDQHNQIINTADYAKET